MTNDDVERDIGRAHMERRDLEKKIACLRHRLIIVGQACMTLANNPLHAESEEAMTKATDPPRIGRTSEKLTSGLMNWLLSYASAGWRERGLSIGS